MLIRATAMVHQNQQLRYRPAAATLTHSLATAHSPVAILAQEQPERPTTTFLQEKPNSFETFFSLLLPLRQQKIIL